jgi:predicted nucleotidyltransferase
MLTYMEILRAVQDSGADYVWIGMNAAGAYGATLGSHDFDFYVRPEPLHLDKARQALRALGMSEAWPEATAGNLIAVGVTDTFLDPYGGPSVDLMTAVDGPSFAEMWRDHQTIEFQGLRVQLASLEHIVASKLAANRPQDRYSLKRLEQDLGRKLFETPAVYRVRRRRK